MVYYYILVVCFVLSLAVGAMVVGQNMRSKVNLIYGLMTLIFLTLSLSNVLSLEPSQNQALFVRIVMASTTAALYLIYFLIVSVRHKSICSSSVQKFFMAFTCLVIILDFTPYVFSDVISGSPARPVPNWGIFLYIAHFFIILVFSFLELIHGIRESKTIDKAKFIYILIGISPILILAPITGVVMPLLFDMPYMVVVTPVYVVWFVCSVGYAVVRHGLFDVQTAIIRSVTYFLTLGMLALIYFVVAFLISYFIFNNSKDIGIGFEVINIILALLLAVIFQPVKRFFDKVTNSVFYRNDYSSNDFFAEFNRLLASTTDLRGILQRAADEIKTTFKAEGSFFFLYYGQDSKHYMSAGTKNYERLTISDSRKIDDFVLSHRNRDVIAVDLLDEESDYEFYKILTDYKISLIMPLWHDNNLIGYLCVGPRQVGRYNSRDLRVLGTVSDGLIIAIQNALSVHAVKEINATLQQRVDEATSELRKSNIELQKLDTAKDEFLSIASHQLRTPLTSVKGYISMLIDGDGGKTTSLQKQLLTEAFKGSERMVGLINDFLNVSRIQSGRFSIDYKKFDMIDLVKDEVDNLKEIVKSHDLSIEFIPDVDVLMVEADENKLRQIIMNFIDNSIYYSKPNTIIKVHVKPIKNDVEVRVKDQGIGVPASAQKKLFTKFFRAQNAQKQRPDGTGVGIYLAKRVVQDHGGKMIFESIEDRGSTFGFRIPRSPKIAKYTINNKN